MYVCMYVYIVMIVSFFIICNKSKILKRFYFLTFFVSNPNALSLFSLTQPLILI